MRKNISFGLFAGLFLALNVTSCNSNESINQSINQEKNEEENIAFKINFDKTLFKVNKNNMKYPYLFKGDISIKNISGYDFSKTNSEEASINILYTDNTTKKYFVTVWTGQYSHESKWKNNSDYVFLLEDNYFLNENFELPFERTPQKISLNFSFNAINIDKEIPFNPEIDLLSKWKDFQVQQGLR